MNEALLRHDLGQMHSDDKWGHLAMPLDDLLDAKDTEITRLRAENAELRNAALEEAALACEARIGPDSSHNAPYNGEDRACAKAVRALKHPK